MTDHEIRGEHTALRLVTEADLDLLVGWFADPGVYAYWDGASKSREEVAQKYTGRRRPRVESFIIEAAGRPIGYLQYGVSDATSGGLDMFLLPAHRHRGLGPDAARALVRHLLEARGWRRVTVDPAADNARAIRAWGKAGFVYERDWPDHPDGPAVLMAAEAGQAAGLRAYLAGHPVISEFRETWAGVPLVVRAALTATEPLRSWVGSTRAIVFRERQILVVAESSGPGLLVGGRLEPGETLDEALVREVAEETGWAVTPGPIIAFWHGHNLGGPPPADWGRPDPDFIDPVYVVEATAFDGAARLDGSPCEFVEIGEAMRRFSGVGRLLLERAVAARSEPRGA